MFLLTQLICCSCVVFTFPVRALNILVILVISALNIVILHSQSDNCKICVTSDSGSDVCFVSSGFFLLLSSMPWLVVKSWIWGKQTFNVRFYVNLARSRALLSACCSYRFWRFTIPWLSWFCLPCCLGVSLRTPSWIESEPCSSVGCNPLLLGWSPAGLMLRSGRGEVSYNLHWISVFRGPVWTSQGFLALPSTPSLRWDRILEGAGSG